MWYSAVHDVSSGFLFFLEVTAYSLNSPSSIFAMVLKLLFFGLIIFVNTIVTSVAVTV